MTSEFIKKCMRCGHAVSIDQVTEEMKLTTPAYTVHCFRTCDAYSKSVWTSGNTANGAGTYFVSDCANWRCS